MIIRFPTFIMKEKISEKFNFKTSLENFSKAHMSFEDTRENLDYNKLKKILFLKMFK